MYALFPSLRTSVFALFKQTPNVQEYSEVDEIEMSS